ncbi:hypothetical protein HBB16_08950 [Pseudonocardia sp. MCCB 268]|nr:hypothetical protein [Pseudonocardia cytotoxica]
MLVLAPLLTIMTTMPFVPGLYQGSRDGWLPRFLGHATGTAPPPGRCGPTWFSTWCKLLLLSDAVFVLAAPRPGYMIFNSQPQRGLMHRLDNPLHPAALPQAPT